ncbi:hypothetical protein AB0M43_35385 [Longispora sp. NPDC051575]|uniref:hypothetical protein n=1 Tax=Longispora sp. NPDC051575 TaxID=3154943 RepID=UPI003429C14B
MLDAVAARVAAGAKVEFRPTGSSMVPLVKSCQLVTVVPVDATKLDVGDINRGRVNGWRSHDRVFGICIAVDGNARPGAAGKARP